MFTHFFLRPQRLAPLLLLTGILALSLLTGCQKSATPYQTGSTAFVVDDTEAFMMCQKRCAQNDELGMRTRKGCERGCEIAREQAPFYDTRYWNLEQCEAELQALDTEAIQKELWPLCQKTWNHLYKRVGCRDAVHAYYNAIRTGLCVAAQQKTPPAHTETQAPPASDTTKQ